MSQLLLLALLLLLLLSPTVSISWRINFKQVTKGTNRFWNQFRNNYSKLTHSSSPTIATNTNQNVISNTISISPILLFFLSISKCDASPLNQQKILLTSPFFQGWLIRTIDHSKQLSFIFIVGSFSNRKKNNYDEHYVFLGINSPLIKKQIDYFPSNDIVTITSGMPTIPFFQQQDLNITWSVSNVGFFKFSEEKCHVKFKLSDVCIEFTTKNRIPWSKRRPNSGPEGWLGNTPFLPCHYYVYSVGSECKYTIKSMDLNNGQRSNSSSRTFDSERFNENYSSPVAGISSGQKLLQYSNQSLERFPSSVNNNSFLDTANNAPTLNLLLEGTGFSHIEGNHGTFFPDGWTWAQCINHNNSASFSLVAGKFVIANSSPMNCVLYLRRRNNETVAFRTTDLHQMSYEIDGINGCVKFYGRAFTTGGSIVKCRKIELVIDSKSVSRQQDQDKKASEINRFDDQFGKSIYVPTPNGFSNEPGCRETYTATAKVKYFEEDYAWNSGSHTFNALGNIDSEISTVFLSLLGEQLSQRKGVHIEQYVEEYEFPLTALEFGGSFVGKRMHKT